MSERTVRSALFIGWIFAAGMAIAEEEGQRSEPTRTPNYSFTTTSLISLLLNPVVQQELRLEESESQKLLESLRKIDPTNNAFPDARRQNLAAYKRFLGGIEEANRKCDAALQKSLSEEQFRRFQQLDLQRQGARALLTLPVAQQLALTAEQQEHLKMVDREFLSERRPGRAPIAVRTPRPDDAQQALRREEFEASLLAVLTPEQTKQWIAMTGEPFKLQNPLVEPSWRLVFAPEVQRELGLSEDEAAAIVQSLEKIHNEQVKEAGQANLSPRTDTEAQRVFDQTFDTVRSSLTVSQWNRLQELVLQKAGVISFAHPEVANDLELNREQRNQVCEMVGDYLPRGLIQVRPPTEKAVVLEILTPDQKTRWEAMQGAKVELRPSQIRIPPARK